MGASVAAGAGLVSFGSPLGALRSHSSRSSGNATTALRGVPRGRLTGRLRSRSYRWTVRTPRPRYDAISFQEFSTTPWEFWDGVPMKFPLCEAYHFPNRF